MKRLFILFIAVALASCGGDDGGSSSSSGYTMCYVKSGNTLTLNCRGESLGGSCSTEGKTSLGTYSTFSSCFSDADAVLSAFKSTGIISPGPGSAQGSGSSGGSSGTGSLAACNSLSYPGDKSDPQTYFYDSIAQFDICALAATNDPKYRIDGDRQCKVLDGLIKATGSTFKPLFCNGPLMR